MKKDLLLFLGQHNLDKLDSAPKVRTYFMHQAFKELVPTYSITGTRVSRILPILKYLFSTKMLRTRMIYLEPSTSASTPIDLLFLIINRILGISIAVFIRDVHQSFGNLYERNTLKKKVLYWGWKLSITVYRQTADILYFPAREMSDYIRFKNKKVLPPGGIKRDHVNYNVHNRTKTIIYVGGNNHFYGIDLFVKAMYIIVHKHPETKCLLLSKGDFSYLNEVQDANWLEIKEASFEEIPEYMENAWLAVSCLRQEGYGKITIALKLFDYMSYGIPILATRCGPQTRFMQENQCGYLVDDNVISIAEGIEYLLNHPEKARQMGENGYINLQKKHLWKYRAKQVISDLESLE